MLYKLSTKELAKESGALAKVSIGTRREAKVAKREEKAQGRKAVAKDKRRVAKVKAGRAGRVARQDILQLGAGKEERRTCTPWTKVTVRTPKNTQTGRLKVKKICRHGAYWKRAKVSSGKK